MELQLLVGQLHGVRTAPMPPAETIDSSRADQARRTQGSKRNREQDRQDAADPVRAAARHRLDRQAARDAVRRRPPFASTAISSGTAEPSDADGRVQRDPEEPAPRLQSLRRPDALHAAHHLVGFRAARRTPARLSGIAWLRPADRRASRNCSGRRPRWARASSSRAPEVAPLEFDHARLFVPRPKMVEAPKLAGPQRMASADPSQRRRRP